MKRRHFCITATLLAMLMLRGPVASAVMVSPVDGHPGAKGIKKAGAMSKSDSSLAGLFSQYRRHINKGIKAPFKPSNRFVQYANGRVLIDARSSTNGDVLLNDLKRLGLQKGERFGTVVSGMFPVNSIDKAVALKSLRSISASPLPILNTGSVLSQGDVAMRADIARSLYDVDGTGISVGVLSDSYNVLSGAAADVASGDLPAGVTVVSESGLCGFLLTCIDEGRAMMQIIHDVAPGADLIFNTGLGGVASYANNITNLSAAGAEVLVDDLMYLTEPMFQDGIIAQAVDQVVADGKVYYSAAGNSARQSYESPFVDSGEDLCIDFIPDGTCDPLYELVGDMHDFDPGPGVDFYQSITIPVGAVLSIALQWNEPFGNVNTGDGPNNDHIIVLLDETGGVMLEISANDNVTTGEPWEVLQYLNDGTYGTNFNIAITFDDYDSPGPPATLMKEVFYGNSTTINEYETHSATVVGHANSTGAEAVGAAFYLETPEYGTAPPLLEPFSSAGGTPIIFDTNGQLLPAPEIRLKPEIVAIDGVNTTFFYSDSHGGDNIPDFFGTSAAAPHAAGVAALMLQANAGATPAQVNVALESSAIDMDVPGFDHDTGYGLIQADAAIGAILASGNTPPTADFTFSSFNLDVNFSDQSDDSDGTIEAWTWNFGDGNTANTQNPSHSYGSSGTYTVTLTVTDDDGATGSASKPVTVTVPDTQAPTITAPADVSVEATGETTPVNLGSPDVSDNLDPNPTMSNDAPTAFPVGTTMVTWTATDASGNSASDTQLVTVTDTTAPSITAPADITVELGDPISLGMPTVSDLADPNPTVSNNAPTAFPVGTTTVTWTATDASGNSASDTQLVTVTEVATQIDLTTSVYKVKGVRMVDLTWNGAAGENVDIYRNGELLANTLNDGSYTDNVGKKPEPSYLYQVCDTNSGNCSSTVTVIIK